MPNEDLSLNPDDKFNQAQLLYDEPHEDIASAKALEPQAPDPNHQLTAEAQSARDGDESNYIHAALATPDENGNLIGTNADFSGLTSEHVDRELLGMYQTVGEAALQGQVDPQSEQPE